MYIYMFAYMCVFCFDLYNSKNIIQNRATQKCGFLHSEKVIFEKEISYQLFNFHILVVAFPLLLPVNIFRLQMVASSVV